MCFPHIFHPLSTEGGGDSFGVVVGTQTSSLDSKNLRGEFTDYSGALQAIIDAPLHNFTYKSGSFNNQEFTGIITDYSPVFGMDRDASHPAGKSLNVVTGLGYTFGAIKKLNINLNDLESRVSALENAGGGGLTGMAADFFNYGVQSVVDGIAYMKGLVLEKLTIGSSSKRTGITFFDEITGDPYCMSVARGVQKVVPGECVVFEATIASAPSGGESSSSPSTDSGSSTGSSPIITLNGETTINLNVGDSYEELGATATDAEDGEVAVIISGSVDTSVDGTYIVTYSASDSNNNTSTAERTVVVGTGESAEPQPEADQPLAEEPTPEETPAEEPAPEEAPLEE
ncbi:MAG: DUF5011 domain-containing protein [Candidatus Paceibacterota bacterium]